MLVFLILVLPVSAYQAGQSNRTNFNVGPSAQPQAAQGQYRSFSNYNNNRGWGQGVQTQTVQTQVAGKEAKELQPVVGKQIAGGTTAKSAKPATAPAAPTSATGSAPTTNMDPAALMQQVQGMMNSMGGNMAGGAAPQGKAGQNVAMPAGMPDLSALMGGAMPAVPAATPAKK